MNTATTCTHCGLPLGCLGQQREVNGETLDFCCYGCTLAYQVTHGANEEPEAASLLIRLGVGAFLAMNIMLFSLLLYTDAFIDSPEFAAFIPWLLLGLATPLLLMIGAPFLGGAWRDLRSGRVGSDALVTIATLAAYGYSVWQLINGSPRVYFDTATMVLMLFTLGRYLEAHARARTTRSLAPILAAERAQARIITNGSESVVAVSEVKPGDRVRILPGERIAVDGVVIEGHSSCDETILTGQSQPQAKQPGDQVHAGSLNGNGPLLISATINGDGTRWVRINRMVRTALASKSGVAITVDRAAGWFVTGVLLLAATTFLFWFLHTDLEHALLNAMAVLVVACPCSLGLAAPLASTLGIGRAAQRGILIRGAGVLESLADLRGIAFDKTGTLTQGKLVPMTFRSYRASTAEALRLVKALALFSTHPVARAVASMEIDMPATTATEIAVTPGAGITGRIDEMYCALGSAQLMESLGWKISESLRFTQGEQHGHTTVYAGWDGQVHARIDFSDKLRNEAASAIATIKERGLRTFILSGDGTREVARIAASLGVDEWQAELLPESKVSTLLRWQEQNGALAMVGDEMNDGPVLAAAKVGIAVGNASALARESADIALPSHAFVSLPWLLELAQEVRHSTRINLIWAFGYNTVALVLAASGHLQPVMAAALMAGSSLLVVTRSLRSNMREQRKEREEELAGPAVE